VLVTGGYGLLGSWLCAALVERGERVVVLAHEESRNSALVLNGTEQHVAVVEGDLARHGTIAGVVAEHDVRAVFHLGAQTIVPIAQADPVATFETNVRGTYLLLDACREAGVGAVVVAASDKAYGAHDELPYREDFALAARYPYDVSKAATDLIARCYWHSYGLPVAVTRFANLYGGGDLNPSRLVPESIAAALARRAPVIRSDGSPERDFLYVEDAVEAYLAIAEAVARGPARGEAYNAGGGRPHSVRDVVELIRRLADSDVAADIRGAGTPAGEIDRQYVDTTKLRELCGWQPRHDLETGLARTIDWYRDHPEALPS
jgi:CDP-glucose 4,6-dehydratase